MRCSLRLLLGLSLGLSLPVFAATPNDTPYAWSAHLATADAALPAVTVAEVDRQALLAEDDANHAARHGQVGTKRMRVARGSDVAASSREDGVWEQLADGSRLWRLRVHAPNATELHLGFGRFQLPADASLFVYSLSERYAAGPYTLADANQFGELWAAAVPGDQAIVELRVPAGSDKHRVDLKYVGAGYRDMFRREGAFVPLGSGSCNINVVCPLGDNYRDEIRSVAHYSFVDGGTWICTGSLINNHAEDGKPYFITANHCVDSNAVAGTMTFYWNYESTQCGTDTGWSMAQNQSGAQLRMNRAATDTTLVELNAVPNAEYNVFYSGWDASGVTPGGVIGIHHPSGDVKKITEDANGISTMNNCIGSGSSTHWRTGEPYTQGTTEGGSSGSGIWIISGDATGNEKLLIGVLSGGNAACSGSVPNSGFDCYGKVSVSWDGANAGDRLRDWLDPEDTGVLTRPGTNGAAPDVIFRHDFECGPGVPGCEGGGDIIVVGPLNVNIPNNIDGVSVNWLTQDFQPGEIAGYHFNPYATGNGNLSFWWAMGNTSAGGVAVADVYSVLGPGDTIGPDSAFSTAAGGSAPNATINWRQPGGVDGYLGFRFTNTDTNQINYGYVRISTTGGVTGFPATILGYAYNNGGYPITIPNP